MRTISEGYPFGAMAQIRAAILRGDSRIAGCLLNRFETLAMRHGDTPAQMDMYVAARAAHMDLLAREEANGFMSELDRSDPFVVRAIAIARSMGYRSGYLPFD